MGGPTEAANPRTADIDLRTTEEIVALLLDEERRVADALAAVGREIAAAADLVVATFARGGAVHSFGAGTSGRLAALDAAELGPTFGLPSGRVVAHLAGESLADARAREAAEDDEADGAAIAEAALRDGDLALGVAASGRTPFVVGALSAARRLGASTILVSCAPGCALGERVDVHVAPDTGAEALAGSTRLKAGTATKIALNAISTAAMIRLGRTYSHYMVHLDVTNAKLRERAERILAGAAALDAPSAEALLAGCGGDLPAALVVALSGVDLPAARSALERCASVRRAVEAVGRATEPPAPAAQPPSARTD